VRLQTEIVVIPSTGSVVPLWSQRSFHCSAPSGWLQDSFVAIALDSEATLAEAAVLARHSKAKVTGQTYAGARRRRHRSPAS